jgi:hypothetical protein
LRQIVAAGLPSSFARASFSFWTFFAQRNLGEIANALIDRHHPPSVPQAINPGNRQRLDQKTQGRFDVDIERDAERSADRSGVDHEY